MISFFSPQVVCGLDSNADTRAGQKNTAGYSEPFFLGLKVREKVRILYDDWLFTNKLVDNLFLKFLYLIILYDILFENVCTEGWT